MNVTLPKMDGLEIRPNVFLIGEPTPIAGTNKLRCLADNHGTLALIELVMTFQKEQ